MRLTQSERDKLVSLLRQPDVFTFALMVGLSMAQLTLASTVDTFSLGMLLKSILFGAPLSHALFMVTLECANNLCFGHDILDRCTGIAANLVTGVPYSELVRHFSAEHLTFHNSRIYKDPEAPSELELTYVYGAGRKILYLIIYPVFYFHRLLFRHALVFTRYLVSSTVLQILFNLGVVYYLGFWSLVYILLSTYVGLSPLHPCAFHLLTSHHRCTDHIDLNSQTRTYSYYGFMNPFTLNAGYHRERHLFRDVPWSKLPLIRQLYFFDDIPTAYYDSVLQAVHDFVYCPGMTLHS